MIWLLPPPTLINRNIALKLDLWDLNLKQKHQDSQTPSFYRCFKRQRKPPAIDLISFRSCLLLYLLPFICQSWTIFRKLQEPFSPKCFKTSLHQLPLCLGSVIILNPLLFIKALKCLCKAIKHTQLGYSTSDPTQCCNKYYGNSLRTWRRLRADFSTRSQPVEETDVLTPDILHENQEL